MNWQPIETAPRDGYPVMLTCRTPYKPFFGFYDSVDGAWFESGTYKCRAPTHWMPLPEPPEGA